MDSTGMDAIQGILQMIVAGASLAVVVVGGILMGYLITRPWRS